ncbi:MAG: DUF2069 domain-containing protein [Pseudomonadales bacterium]|nr:DUF2069 domain-containing protein [Pseudomonadales bacterium]
MQGWLFLSYVALGSLFALTGLRQFFIAPLADLGPNVIWFAIQVAPLVLTLPGMLAGTIRSTFLLCLGSLLYFVHGVVVVYDGGLVVIGSFEIAFALTLCGTTAFLVRKLREAEAAAQI